MDKETTVGALMQKVDEFINEREWEKFHTAKNVSMSIAIEAAELMEHFQWIDPSCEELKNKEEIADEAADIAMYLFDFCRITGIDLAEAVNNKLKKNRIKYPAEKVKGRCDKYTAYRKQKS